MKALTGQFRVIQFLRPLYFWNITQPINIQVSLIKIFVMMKRVFINITENDHIPYAFWLHVRCFKQIFFILTTLMKADINTEVQLTFRLPFSLSHTWLQLTLRSKFSFQYMVLRNSEDHKWYNFYSFSTHDVKRRRNWSR